VQPPAGLSSGVRNRDVVGSVVATAEQWSVEQRAAIATAEAIAMAAAADVAAEAAATARAAVDVAAAAALKAAHRAQDVAAAARAAVDAVPTRRADFPGGDGRDVGRTPAADAGSGPSSMAAAAVSRRVEMVATAAALAVVEAASVIERQLAADVAAAAEAVTTVALVLPEGSLPAADDVRRTPSASSSPRTPTRTERPVFVVDADPACRLLIGQSLATLGLGNPCLEFSDGSSVIRAMQQCLDAGAGQLPALVLLDTELTGTSGADVLEWMVQTHGLTGIPVIMLSARDSAVDVTRAYRLGARSYLVKPVGFRALGSVARNLGLPWTLV
jgi:CheY-like chemotaxis protein